MRNRKGRLLIWAGCLLLFAAAALTGYNVLDEMRAAKSAEEAALGLETLVGAPKDVGNVLSAHVDISIPSLPDDETQTVSITIPEQEMAEPDQIRTLPEIEIPDYILNPRMDMPVVRYEDQDYIGLLEIPALGLKLPVMSEWSYPRLKKAPCRYTGTAYLDNLVISAHNYERHFGKLKELREGSRVMFTDADGNRFSYRVVLIETLMPTDIRDMTSGEFDLTLFTCTVGGKHRVTVRCDKME